MSNEGPAPETDEEESQERWTRLCHVHADALEPGTAVQIGPYQFRRSETDGLYEVTAGDTLVTTVRVTECASAVDVADAVVVAWNTAPEDGSETDDVESNDGFWRGFA